MHKRLLPHDPICNLDEAIVVFPFAIVVLAKYSAKSDKPLDDVEAHKALLYLDLLIAA